jgi:DDHD domain
MKKEIVSTTTKIGTAFGSKPGEVPAEPEPVDTSEIEKVEKMMKALNPQARVDFALQESVLEVSYMSSIGVHMSYWWDSDCSALMIRALYGIEHRVGLD